MQLEARQLLGAKHFVKEKPFYPSFGYMSKLFRETLVQHNFFPWILGEKPPEYLDIGAVIACSSKLFNSSCETLRQGKTLRATSFLYMSELFRQALVQHNFFPWVLGEKPPEYLERSTVIAYSSKFFNSSCHPFRQGEALHPFFCINRRRPLPPVKSKIRWVLPS